MLLKLLSFIIVVFSALSVGVVSQTEVAYIDSHINTASTLQSFVWYWDSVGFGGAVLQTAADLKLWWLVDLISPLV